MKKTIEPRPTRARADDATERQRAEEAVRESEWRFAQVFHASPMPTTITTLADGRKGIAEQLVVAEMTVQKHVSNILSKLHLASRTQFLK